MISGEAQENSRVDFFAAGTDFLAVLDEEDFFGRVSRTFQTTGSSASTGTNDKPAALWTSTGFIEDLPEAEPMAPDQSDGGKDSHHGHYNLIGINTRRSQGNPHAGIQEKKRMGGISRSDIPETHPLF